MGNRLSLVVIFSFFMLLVIRVFIFYIEKEWKFFGTIKTHISHIASINVASTASIDMHNRTLYEKYGYNAVLSDQISVNRSVPDVRPEECLDFNSSVQLPKVAIIIVFYNERLSVLLRTVHSIINRTPNELLQEIVLVDDCSTFEELYGPLEEYVEKYFPPKRSKLRLIRMAHCAGLMAARMTGARAASKDSVALIFMDAHFEVNYDWLPPLLEPIALNPKTCTCAALDYISHDKFEYKQNDGFRGYFNWALKFIYFPLYVDEMDTDENWRDYILSGASLAIGADFFWDLGGFDEGMLHWEGADFELSFKIWMCGGEIMQVPCSRMAHLIRDPAIKIKRQYGKHSFVDRNLRRLIDVWMDEEYRQYVFKRLPSLKEADPGDISERIAIRERMKCMSFAWMLENVMPNVMYIYPPIEPNDLANGLLRSVFDPTLCLTLGEHKNLVLDFCTVNDTINGYRQWTYNWRGQISTGNTCLESDFLSVDVFATTCSETTGDQRWYYDRDRQWIMRVERNLCIFASIEEGALKLSECDPDNLRFKWAFTQMNSVEMDMWEDNLRWGRQ